MGLTAPRPSPSRSRRRARCRRPCSSRRCSRNGVGSGCWTCSPPLSGNVVWNAPATSTVAESSSIALTPVEKTSAARLAFVWATVCSARGAPFFSKSAASFVGHQLGDLLAVLRHPLALELVGAVGADAEHELTRPAPWRPRAATGPRRPRRDGRRRARRARRWRPRAGRRARTAAGTETWAEGVRSWGLLVSPVSPGAEGTATSTTPLRMMKVPTYRASCTAPRISLPQCSLLGLGVVRRHDRRAVRGAGTRGVLGTPRRCSGWAARCNARSRSSARCCRPAAGAGRCPRSPRGTPAGPGSAPARSGRRTSRRPTWTRR